jgi:hypothetical protein
VDAPIVLGHRQNEIALVRLEAFEEGVELGGHGRAVAAGVGLDNMSVSTRALASAIVD